MNTDPAPPRRTLLVGCGRLGTRLGLDLVARGGSVVALRRSIEALPAAFTNLAVDLGRPSELVLPAVDAVVVTLPPPPAVDGYRRMLERIRDALPRIPERVVFVSSTGVFAGWDGPQPIDERYVPRPSSERSSALVDGERAAAQLLGATIVRPAGIYGPGREFLIRAVREGRPLDHAKRTNRIHEEDLVRALAALLAAESAPAVLHAVDDRPAPLGEVLAGIADLLGAPVPPHRPGDERGNVFGNGELIRLIHRLRYPGFLDGYRQILGAGGADRP